MFFPQDLGLAAFTSTVSSLLVTQFIVLPPNRQHICSFSSQGSSSPGVIKAEKPLVILSLTDTRYKSNQDYVGHTTRGGHTVLYTDGIFFFFTGYFQSFVTTIWCGEPLQCQSTGAAEDHQPSCPAAKTAVLSLSEKWPERKASTFYTLCHLWFHCQGQLLLQWPRWPVCTCRWLQTCQGPRSIPRGT